MRFVAYVPSLVLIALLVGGWSVLAYLAWNRLSIRHWAMNGLLVVTAIQGVAGISVAVATELNHISRYAGAMGSYGAVFNLILIAGQFGGLVVLPLCREGSRKQIAAWLSMWIFFSLIAFLTHVRSALFCTV